VKAVKTTFVPYPEQDQDTYDQPEGEAGDIDERIELIL